MKTNSKALREQLNFFINFTRAFDRYLEIREKIKIQLSINQVCKEIETSPSILIVLNDKAEELAKEQEENQQHKSVCNKPVNLFQNEEDILSPHSKLYQCQRAINPSCFGQRSMNTSFHLFDGKEEMKIMSYILKQQIKKVLKESFYFASSDTAIHYIDEGQCQYVMLSHTRKESKKTKENLRYLNPLFNDPNNSLNQIRILANDNIINSYKESVMKKQNEEKANHLLVQSKRARNSDQVVSQKKGSSNRNRQIKMGPLLIENNINAIKMLKTYNGWSSEKKLDKELFGIKKTNKISHATNPLLGKHFDYTQLFALRIMK